MAWEAWLVGTSAVLAQLAAGECAAAMHGTHTSPLRAIGKWLIDALPTPLIDIGVALLRRADKPVIAATLVSLHLATGAVAAAFGTYALGIALAALGALGLLALWRRVELSRVAAASIGSLATAAGLVGVGAGPSTALLMAAALAIVALAARNLRRSRAAGRAVVLPELDDALAPPPRSAALDIPGLSPLFTPVEDFFVTDVTFPTPVVDPARWRLTLHGLVDRPLSLSYAELLALPATEVDSVLMCVHNPVGGPFIGNARWRGVRLADVLERAGVAAQADHARLHAVDGFTAGISLPLLHQGFDPLLAYAMNGVPLTRQHGAPVRMLVPGIHGYDANIKWLASIELTRFADAIDYAERKGWPRVPSRMAPNARIDVPSDAALIGSGERTVAGVAWSPPHGVTQVELRVDGGPWRSCHLATALGPCAWVQWSIAWDATPGRHTLEVRAWGLDRVQREADAPPYPTGARGYHSIAVDVASAGIAHRRRTAWWLARQARARWDLALSGVHAWRRGRRSSRR